MVPSHSWRKKGTDLCRVPPPARLSPESRSSMHDWNPSKSEERQHHAARTCVEVGKLPSHCSLCEKAYYPCAHPKCKPFIYWESAQSTLSLQMLSVPLLVPGGGEMLESGNLVSRCALHMWRTQLGCDSARLACSLPRDTWLCYAATEAITVA